jgi:hypothetical protein
MDYWPSNPDVITTQPVFLEEGPHYDNYEEFYRPYTYVDPETSISSIRYMHTNPTKPDTDGDGLLDPDDYEPLGWANDGISPGGADLEAKKTSTNDDLNHPNENLELAKEPYYGTSEHFDFEIKIVPTTSTNSQNTNKNNDLPDIDNDGI